MMSRRKIFISILIVIIVVSIFMGRHIKKETFNLKFYTSDNFENANNEMILFEGTLIEFPFNKFYINGNLIIDDTKYRAKSYELVKGMVTKDENGNYLKTFKIYFHDYYEDGNLIGASAVLAGGIIEQNSYHMIINRSIMENAELKSYGEPLHCFRNN